MTVGQLLDSADSRELSAWMAYYSIEPFGQDRQDYAVAIQSALIANTTPGVKRRYKPGDFMPGIGVRPEQTEAEMRAIVKRFKNA